MSQFVWIEKIYDCYGCEKLKKLHVINLEQVTRFVVKKTRDYSPKQEVRLFAIVTYRSDTDNVYLFDKEVEDLLEKARKLSPSLSFLIEKVKELPEPPEPPKPSEPSGAYPDTPNLDDVPF